MVATSSDLSADGSPIRPLRDGELVRLPNVVLDDEVLIRQAFEVSASQGCDLLFRRYYQPLCSHAVRFVYSKMLAEDIVADIFQNFWQKRLYERIQLSYRAYLYKAVRQNCLLYLQREMGHTVSTDLIPPLDFNSLTTLPAEQIQFDELKGQIESVINALSPSVRRVFLLSRFEEKRNQQIADELCISLKTVEAHITKALTLFRKVLLP